MVRPASVARFVRRPRAERTTIIEALAWLTLAQAALAFVRFERLARFLGTERRETPVAPVDGEWAAGLVGRCIDVAARHTPWESRCLAQALAATAMLRRRGLPATTSFGVARGSEGALKAHAWVRCGTTYVTGGATRDDYQVLATFASAEATQSRGGVLPH